MKRTIIGLLSLAFAGLFVGRASADIKIPPRPACLPAEAMGKSITSLGDRLSQTTGMIDGSALEVWIGASTGTYVITVHSLEKGMRCIVALGKLEGEGA